MPSFFRVFLLCFAALLTACGGGGGGGKSPSSLAPSSSSSKDASSAVSSSAPASSAKSSATSSSSVATVKILVKGAITAQNDIDSTGLDADSLAIEIHVLDSKRQILRTLNPDAADFGATGSMRFNTEVDATGGKFVTINASHPGFTTFSRSLEIAELINFEALLQAVPVQTVGIEESRSISGAVVEGFAVNVSAEDDDRQRDSLQIQIPRSLLPEDTTSLDVAVRTFDPNEPEDALLFPGAYADSDGNNLVSVAFNFTEINTDAGEPLVQAMRKARQQKISKAGGLHKAADDEQVIINRQIPLQSCRLLETLGDSDPLTNGFQVPIYTYNPNSGVWDLLGHGTIYNQAGQMSAANQKTFDCDNQNYYLEIRVTNEIFLRDWWNLDYPLTFSQPVNYCARVQLKNAEGEKLAGLTGTVMDTNGDLDFTTGYFTTDAEGYANITVSQAGNETKATLLVYKAGSYRYEQKTISISNNCAQPVVQVVEIDRAAMCSVSGKLSFKNGTPAEREVVYGIATEYNPLFGWDFVNSDKDGNYRLNLPCNGEYQIAPLSAWARDVDLDQWYVTNIDGELQADELSDDGKSVQMKPFELDYKGPMVNGYYDVENKRLMVFFWAPYSTLPISFTGTLSDASGKSYGSVSGTASIVPQSDNNDLGFYTMARAAINFNLSQDKDNEILVIKLNATDALNNQWKDVEGYISNGFSDYEDWEDLNP